MFHHCQVSMSCCQAYRAHDQTVRRFRTTYWSNRLLRNDDVGINCWNHAKKKTHSYVFDTSLLNPSHVHNRISSALIPVRDLDCARRPQAPPIADMITRLRMTVAMTMYLENTFIKVTVHARRVVFYILSNSS